MIRTFVLSTLFLSFISISNADQTMGNGPDNSKPEKAIFAGGCFWSMTSLFEKLHGVVKVISGYTGGTGANPTYQDYEEKGHMEAVEVAYDPFQITYADLLDAYWKQVDPTDSVGQFCDRGPQYRPAIFYDNEEQRQLIEQSRDKLAKSGKFDKPIVVESIKASTFYPAEEYHQDYYKKNPLQYKSYRFKCGRDQFLEKIWGKSAGH